jgi:hypothetical protein
MDHRAPTGFNPDGMTVDVRDLPAWSRYRFLAGANRYIQQESTFWRRSLWEKAGARLDDSYRDVGDFDCGRQIEPVRYRSEKFQAKQWLWRNFIQRTAPLRKQIGLTSHRAENAGR